MKLLVHKFRKGAPLQSGPDGIVPMSSAKDIKHERAPHPERHQEGLWDHERNGHSSETPQPELAKYISPAVASSMRLAEELIATQKEFEAFIATSRAKLFQAVQQELQFQLSQTIHSINATSALERAHSEESVSDGIQRLDASSLKPQASQNATKQTLSDGASLIEDTPASSSSTPLAAEGVHQSGTIPAEEASLVNSAEAPQTISFPTQPTHNSVSHQQGVEEERTIEGKPVDTEAGPTYSETVHISVTPGPGANQALRFVDDLCKWPKVRLQRLVGSRTAGLDLWLLLREPTDVQNALQEMRDVAAVSRFPANGTGGAEHRLLVQLR